VKKKRKTAKARPKNKRSKRATKRPLLRNAEQYFAMPEDRQLQWNRATHVLQRMRSHGVSLSQAAREIGISRRKVIDLSGSALKKQANGRYAARTFDRLLRVLVIPSRGGLTEIAVRDSRTASKLGEYSAAVQRFIQTGDQSKLRQFKKLKLKDTSGNPIKFLTDPKAIMRLGNAGVLSFESIYARVA
jgi:hypothetical protein